MCSLYSKQDCVPHPQRTWPPCTTVVRLFFVFSGAPPDTLWAVEGRQMRTDCANEQAGLLQPEGLPHVLRTDALKI